MGTREARRLDPQHGGGSRREPGEPEAPLLVARRAQQIASAPGHRGTVRPGTGNPHRGGRDRQPVARAHHAARDPEARRRQQVAQLAHLAGNAGRDRQAQLAGRRRAQHERHRLAGLDVLLEAAAVDEAVLVKAGGLLDAHRALADRHARRLHEAPAERRGARERDAQRLGKRRVVARVSGPVSGRPRRQREGGAGQSDDLGQSPTVRDGQGARAGIHLGAGDRCALVVHRQHAHGLRDGQRPRAEVVGAGRELDRLAHRHEPRRADPQQRPAGCQAAQRPGPVGRRLDAKSDRLRQVG